MRKIALAFAILGTTLTTALFTAPAHAQATRTWVSGVGDDVNPCSRTAPCKTWAGAISKTAAGSEIDALDPGAFGAVTINKSITIDGGGGQVASTLAANTNGFVVAAGATDIVVIRNVRVQGGFGNGGTVNPGLSGIVFQSGKALVVDNCDITGFSVNGVSVTGAGYVAVNNTRIENVGNAGIGTGAVAANVEIDNSRVYLAKFGVAAGNTAKVMLHRSVISNASTTAVNADPGGVVALSGNVISFSTTGLGGGGTFNSFNDSRLIANGSNGTAPNKIGSQSDPFGME